MGETRQGSTGHPTHMQQDGDEGDETSPPADPPLIPLQPPKGRRSGEGMHSVLEHLREHLRRKDVEQPRDDEPPPPA